MTFPGLLIEFLTPKTPLGWVNFFPISIGICVPNLVAVRRSCRKNRGDADTHTHKQTARDTAAL